MGEGGVGGVVVAFTFGDSDSDLCPSPPQNGLMVAISKGFIDIVTTLHVCPLIDINHQDNDGNTALMIAAQAGACARRVAGGLAWIRRTHVFSFFFFFFFRIQVSSTF